MPPIPRQSDKPRAGYYLIRLARGGPFVGASIAWHETDGWTCMVDGECQGPSLDPWLLPFMETIHFYGKNSTSAEVKFKIGLKRFCEIYAPNEPAANPRKPINPDTFVPI